MGVLRIMVADDHEVVRKGLVALLQAQPDWQVCGEAGDGREAVEKAIQLKPDILILDIGMPSLNGLEATRQILKTTPNARVLILTLHDSDQVVREVLNAGARGFLLKSDAARDLVAAVDALRHDKTYFTSKVAAMVLEGYLKGGIPGAAITPGRNRLTPREREIVQLRAHWDSALKRLKRTAPTSCASSNCTRSATWFFMPSGTTLSTLSRQGSNKFGNSNGSFL